MRLRRATLHPYFQLILLFILPAGAFITKDIAVLVAGYAIVLVLIIMSKQFGLHLKMMAFANLPFLLFLLLVYGLILNNRVPSREFTGIQYSFILFLKVTVLTSVFQYLFNKPADELLYLLRKWKLKGPFLIIVISSFTIWKGFRLRADQIITARLSRGYLKSRSIWNRFTQLSSVIKPLFIGALMAGLERSSAWKQRDLFGQLNNISPRAIPIQKSSAVLGVSMVLISAAWLYFSILTA